MLDFTVAMETSSESGWSRYSVDPDISVSIVPLVNWKCQERGSEVLPRTVMAGYRPVLPDDTTMLGRARTATPEEREEIFEKTSTGLK